MKKKIGVITFANAYNNGAFLQTYALQTYLERYGYEVEQMLPNIEKIDKNINKSEIKLRKKFVDYRKKYIHFIEDDISTSFKKYNAYSKYYAVITGSDQVWNKNITKGYNRDYYLATVPPFVKRISYAASIGQTEHYNDTSAEVFKCMLKNVDAISLREESAKKFLERHLPYRDIQRHIDPTLLLDGEDYSILYENVKLDLNEKYIFLFLVGANNKVIEYTRKLSEKYNLKVIHNYEKGTFKNEKFVNCSVGEFLGYIKNAEVVITGSFHGMIFSLLFRKKLVPFVVNRGIRVVDLVKLLGIENILNPSQLINIEKYNIDYGNIDKILKKERKKSYEFLMSALENDSSFEDSFLVSGDKYSCYGCTACEKICPVKAITMSKDEEGFLYPKIDQSKCINCGLCKKRCIYKNRTIFSTQLNMDERKAFAAYIKDEKKLADSTSGGMYSALSDYFLANKKGYVVGVRYDDDLVPVYDITNDIEKAKLFRGSKYVLPKLNDIYEKTKEKLDKGNHVLFVGSSCVVAGLKSYLNKDYDKLLTIDFICHGYPSNEIFKKYVYQIERNENKKIVNVNFRNKSAKGWDTPHIEYNFEDGTKQIKRLGLDYYYCAFGAGKIQKRSCYNCEFFMHNKPSDITICDFWAIRKKMHLDMYNNNKGVSGLFINTEKGEKIFNSIKKNCVIKNIPFEDVFSGNICYPIDLSDERIKIFDDLKNPPISAILDQYVNLEKKSVSRKRQLIRLVIPKRIRQKVKRIIKKK